MAAILSPRVERRRSPRGRAPAFGLIERAVLRPGVPVALRTVSLAGALVTSASPVRPGARTDLAIEAVAGERWVLGVTVVRCWVVSISPLRYCAAVEFEARGLEGMGSGYPEVV